MLISVEMDKEIMLKQFFKIEESRCRNPQKLIEKKHYEFFESVLLLKYETKSVILLKFFQNSSSSFLVRTTPLSTL